MVRESAAVYGGADLAGEEADALLLLGDRIAELARSIQVAEAEMMRLIVEFDGRRGWAEAGFGSCAEWLAWRIGVRPGAARERVRTARALARLPLAAGAMAAGELPYAKARALTRVATPESEEALLNLARAGSAENLERVVRAWKAMDDTQELTVEQARHRRRRFSVVVADDGSYVVRGRLDPEAGAMLMRAVEAAADALYRDEKGDSSAAYASDTGTECETTPAQRRADAVGVVAERALVAGFGEADEETGGPVSVTRADRYQVLLHVEPDTLIEGRPSGRSELDGVRMCKATARRLTCDTAMSQVEHAGMAAPGVTAGTSETRSTPARPVILGVGRRTRTVPPALRRALLVRDRGCRFPGCGSRFVEAHHIIHWADGGRTDLDNLVLLCLRHHRAVHEDGMTICMDREAAVVFFTPKGRAVAATPAPGDSPRSARPLPAPPPSATAYPGSARHRRDRDIPWPIEAQVWDALDTP